MTVSYHNLQRCHQYPTSVINTKGSLIDRRGILIELDVKEIVKIPQEVTEKHRGFFPMQRSWNPAEVWVVMSVQKSHCVL